MKQFKSFAQSLKQKASTKVKEEITKNPEVEKLSFTIKQKENEVKKMKMEFENLAKERQELLAFKEQSIKEKESYAIRSELSKAARKLNVRDTALDDVVGLLETKFKVTDGKVYAQGPEEGSIIEPEQFLGEWLQTKEHFIQPTAAPSAKVTPAPQGPLPAKKPETTGGSLAENINNRLGLKSIPKR
jgi:uncharacterized membrane protein YgaE (UPF0421/DUF939 family)